MSRSVGGGCDEPFARSEQGDCVHATETLGVGYAVAVVLYAAFAATLLFGFLRSWLLGIQDMNRRDRQDYLAANLLMRILGSAACFFMLFEVTNLHGLIWRNRSWSAVGTVLFLPCLWSMCVLRYRESGFFFEQTQQGSSIQRRTHLWSALHVTAWVLALAAGVLLIADPKNVAYYVGAAYVCLCALFLPVWLHASWLACKSRSLHFASSHDRAMLLYSLAASFTIGLLVTAYMACFGSKSFLEATGAAAAERAALADQVSFPVLGTVGKAVRILICALVLVAWVPHENPAVRSCTTANPASSASWHQVEPLTLAAICTALCCFFIAVGFGVWSSVFFDVVFHLLLTVVPWVFLMYIFAQLRRDESAMTRDEESILSLITFCKARLAVAHVRWRQRFFQLGDVAQIVVSGCLFVSLALKLGDAGSDSSLFLYLTWPMRASEACLC